MNATVPVTTDAASTAQRTRLATAIHKPVEADIPVDSIDAKPGFNPRIYFKRETLEELAESIANRGVLEPIIVRPQHEQSGRYWIIAGERRVRAARIAGLATIPCRIFDVDELEAQTIAAIENGQRQDLSPGEEARDARRMMIGCRGDRKEAALRLGWNASKFDLRLALSHATEEVLIALAEERISLGHAELLCPLPEVTQNGTLEEVLKRKITITELKAKLDHFALDLGTACFDKAACHSCPNNTTLQASLFEQHVGAGRCTNRPCFQNKTITHLSEMRVALRDEHNAVHLDTERDASTYTLVLKRDVGDRQYEQGCKQCANFGCVLASRLGQAGKLTNDVCFDLECHEEKKLDYQKQIHAAATSADGADNESNATPQQSRRASATSPPTAAHKKNGKGTVATTNDVPKRVQEKIHAIQRRAAGVEVQRNVKMTQVYAVMALLREAGALAQALDGKDPLQARDVKREKQGDRGRLIARLYQLELPALQEIAAELAAYIAGSEMTNQAMQTDAYLKGMQTTHRVLDIDLAKHFVVDADFLQTHTKDGIEALLREAQFVAHCNRANAAAFAKLMKLRHPDLVAAVFKSGFDFQGFVPRALQIPAK